MSATPSAFTVEFSWRGTPELNGGAFRNFYLCVGGKRALLLTGSNSERSLTESCGLTIERLPTCPAGLTIYDDGKRLQIESAEEVKLLVDVITKNAGRVAARRATFFSTAVEFAIDTTQFTPGMHHTITLGKSTHGDGLQINIQSIGDAGSVEKKLYLDHEPGEGKEALVSRFLEATAHPLFSVPGVLMLPAGCEKIEQFLQSEDATRIEI